MKICMATTSWRNFKGKSSNYAIWQIFPVHTVLFTHTYLHTQISPVFSANAENAVNFQVNFINLHHPLQGLKLPSLHLWKIENLIFVHHLHHSLHHFILTSLFTSHFTAKLDFCPSFTSSFTSLFTYINIYITFYSKTWVSSLHGFLHWFLTVIADVCLIQYIHQSLLTTLK